MNLESEHFSLALGANSNSSRTQQNLRPGVEPVTGNLPAVILDRRGCYRLAMCWHCGDISNGDSEWRGGGGVGVTGITVGVLIR